MDFVIRRATEQDIPQLVAIMEEAVDNPQHPDWFVSDDADFIREHLDVKGFVLAAEAPAKEIAGFFIVKYPEPGENLGTFLNYTEDQLAHTAIMDSAAVARNYRGHKLQARMAQAAEALIDPERFRYLLCTIHPDNRFSLSNMQSQGYVVKAEVRCYGGKRRYVLEKCLTAKNG